jgi:magnesium transporter
LVDHQERIADSTETFRDLVNGALDTYSSIVSAKTTETLRMLTMISTIMMPLTFITGLMGMNVPLPGEEKVYSLWIIIGILLLVVLFMFIYFKRKRWL